MNYCVLMLSMTNKTKFNIMPGNEGYFLYGDPIQDLQCTVTRRSRSTSHSFAILIIDIVHSEALPNMHG